MKVKSPAKCALFVAARALGALWSLIPARLRRALIYGLIAVESRAGAPATGVNVVERHILWGEIWANREPVGSDP